MFYFQEEDGASIERRIQPNTSAKLTKMQRKERWEINVKSSSWYKDCNLSSPVSSTLAAEETTFDRIITDC